MNFRILILRLFHILLAVLCSIGIVLWIYALGRVICKDLAVSEEDRARKYLTEITHLSELPHRLPLRKEVCSYKIIRIK
jgi:hypothetical protein